MTEHQYEEQLQYTPTYSLPPTSESFSQASHPENAMALQAISGYGMHPMAFEGQLVPMTLPSSQSPIRHRHFSSIGGSSFLDSRNPFAAGPVRRRISRACDQCNQLRTKCDGKTICAHCVGMLDLSFHQCFTR
jgi:hypothetical protein